MNGLFLVMMFSLSSAVWSNDWTPPIAAEGAIMTIEMEVSAVPKPLPTPNPDGARKGAKLESPLDTYREAKTLIEKGNALADRGKAILDQAQEDGKITVDIRLPNASATESPSRRKSCSGGSCPLSTDAAHDSPKSSEPAQTCSGGACKQRRFLRWRR